MIRRFFAWLALAQLALAPINADAQQIRRGARGGGAPTLSSLSGTTTDTATAGTVVATPVSNLSGCTWSIASQTNFAQVSGTGVVTKSNPRVTAGNYTPSVTCTVTSNNQTIAITAPLSLSITSSGVPFAPGYLNTTPAAPYAAWGAQKLVSTYSGALFRLRRSSDGATLDVSPQTGGDFPDYAAIQTWAGTANLTVTTIYDQSGNGRNLTQANVANQPAFDLAVADGGRVPIAFDGYTRSTDTAPLNWRNKFLSTSISLDRINHTILLAGIPINSQNQSGISQTLNAGASVLGVASTGLTVGTLSPAPRTIRNVWGYGKTSSGNQWRANGSTTFQASASTTQSMDTIAIGTSNTTASSNASGAYKLFGAVVYATGLSATDGDTVANSLLTAISAYSTFDYHVVWDGDSIMEGTGSTMLRSAPQLVQAQLTKNFGSYTTAVHGQQVSTIYANRAARFAPIYVAGKTNVVFLEGGINDISAAGLSGANLYNNNTAPLISYLKSLGYRVVVCTLLPFNANGNWTSAKESERLAYNALVVANSAGADYVLDFTQNPAMGATSASSDTTLYIDGLHPTSLGYQYLAGAASGAYANQYTYYFALRSVLRTALSDPSYVP